MYLFKQFLKYCYFNILKKKLNVSFTAVLDKNSVFGKYSVFQSHVLIGDSKIGSNVIIKERTAIKRSELADNICIHEDCKVTESTIDSFSYVAKSSEILGATVGKFCSIGPEVWIGLGKHPSDFISTSPVFYSASKKQLGFSFTNQQLFQEHKKCVIGNDVWIGARVMVLDGVTIGDGAIVAANSVVSKDVEPYSIVGGSPAKLIKMRFDELTTSKLLTSAWWNWDTVKIKEKSTSFQKRIITYTDLDI